MRSSICLSVLLGTFTSAQNILSDPGALGPTPEIVHLYYDQWPTGIAVSASGRKFSNYPPLDPNNVNGYTVAELTSNNTETPFPSLEINSPPGGRINYTTYPPTSANYPNYLIGVQSVVIDPADRLWILDTGRTSFPNGTLLPASYGGPKLIGVNLTSNSIFQSIIFSPTAAPPDSYLNDVRFDLTPSLTPSGQGIAYITDSSSEGRNAIVVVDLGTGEAWRRLENHPSVHPDPDFVPWVWGEPVYMNPGQNQTITNVGFGADGIALSADGETLYYSPVATRNLYSVPTALLRDRSPYAVQKSNAAVQLRGTKGVSDGMETDSNGLIYAGNVENNEIVVFNPETGLFESFVRDPRFSWTDTMSVAADGYLYFTENQLWLSSSYQGGVDKRKKPWVVFRVPLKGNGTKVTQGVGSG
jgi:sugar lactone lactonase YvrE